MEAGPLHSGRLVAVGDGTGVDIRSDSAAWVEVITGLEVETTSAKL